jgi:hypothetical protein
MRTAILGAAASALLGGTLAITPVTSVSSIPASGGPGCDNCEQAGSLVMPETAKPQAPAAAPAAEVGGPSNRPEPAANLIAPGATAQHPASSGAYTASPGVSAVGGAPDAGAPGLGGEPDVPGMDQVAGLAPAAAGISSIPEAANAVQSVWGTVVAVPTSLVGIAGSAAGVVSSLSLSLFYLEYSGLLPKNLSSGGGLSSILPGVGLPLSLQSAAAAFNPSSAAANVPGAAAAVRGAVAAAIPGRSAGIPGALAAIRGAAPQLGLPRAPALPALPGPRALLPHPHLPGPMAILKPHCIGPHLGPIGACIP